MIEYLGPVSHIQMTRNTNVNKKSNFRRYFHGRPVIRFAGDVLEQLPTADKCDVCGRSTKYRSVFTRERHCSEECNHEAFFQIFQKMQERG